MRKGDVKGLFVVNKWLISQSQDYAVSVVRAHLYPRSFDHEVNTSFDRNKGWKEKNRLYPKGKGQMRRFNPRALRAPILLVVISTFLITSASRVRGGRVVDDDDENDGSIELVFTDEELSRCGAKNTPGIRIPQTTVTPSGVLLLAQCRQAVASPGAGGLEDDQSRARVISKFSHDNGTTWGPMQVLSGEGVGFSHGQAVYDRKRKRVLLQYQYHPSTDPEFNSTLFQSVSGDDGMTWGSPRDITKKIATCNPNAPHNMQVGTAGSKIQTSSGRILFVGHASKGQACRWWTDDGGETYETSSNYLANEASVAEVHPNGWIYMNGRSGKNSWKPNRTSWTSRDDGTSFSPPRASTLVEDNNEGCSAGLVAEPSTGDHIRRLFFSEPAGPGRVGLRVHCSLDGGETWPHSVPVGDATDAAGYSSLRFVTRDSGNVRLLVVWEWHPENDTRKNFKYTIIDTDWCGENQSLGCGNVCWSDYDCGEMSCPDCIQDTQNYGRCGNGPGKSNEP